MPRLYLAIFEPKSGRAVRLHVLVMRFFANEAHFYRASADLAIMKAPNTKIDTKNIRLNLVSESDFLIF